MPPSAKLGVGTCACDKPTSRDSGTWECICKLSYDRKTNRMKHNAESDDGSTEFWEQEPPTKRQKAHSLDNRRPRSQSQKMEQETIESEPKGKQVDKIPQAASTLEHTGNSKPTETSTASTNATAKLTTKTPTDTDTNTDTAMLSLQESIGDIFSSTPNSLLIHACNCEGSWGAGIAAAFKRQYPSAYKHYAAHCRAHGHKLFSKALLIPPDDKSSKAFIGCLFTSRSKGKKKDSPEAILEATGPAMRDLMAQVREWNESVSEDDEKGKVMGARMCKINSGLFAVPWEETKAVIEGVEVKDIWDWGFKEVDVISRE